MSKKHQKKALPWNDYDRHLPICGLVRLPLFMRDAAGGWTQCILMDPRMSDEENDKLTV